MCIYNATTFLNEYPFDHYECVFALVNYDGNYEDKVNITAANTSMEYKTENEEFTFLFSNISYHEEEYYRVKLISWQIYLHQYCICLDKLGLLKYLYLLENNSTCLNRIRAISGICQKNTVHAGGQRAAKGANQKKQESCRN